MCRLICQYFYSLANQFTHWEDARLGRMAGTILGVKATTVLCANSKKVRIHSIAVDWTSSSARSGTSR